MESDELRKEIPQSYLDDLHDNLIDMAEPTVPYHPDPLKMANNVIELQRARAVSLIEGIKKYL